MITDRGSFNSLQTGIQLMCSLRALFPGEWETKNLNRLLSSTKVRDAVLEGHAAAEIEALWADDLAAFQLRRAEFLIYK